VLTKLQLIRLVTEHGMKDGVRFTTPDTDIPRGLVTDGSQRERTNR
jgi:hypothetical protein